jgi:hypothetical protein
MSDENSLTCAECDRLTGWLAEAVRAYSDAVKRMEDMAEGVELERASQEAREAHRLCEECRTAIIEHDQIHECLQGADARRAAPN